MRIVALIPARQWSKRLPGKNLKPLGGKPLIQWTLDVAHASQLFEAVYVCTDDPVIPTITAKPTRIIQRPAAPDDQPDIVWVTQALTEITPQPEAFAILRPTSPFRTVETLRRALTLFQRAGCDSLRAVQPVTEHPGKMWKLQPDGTMTPVWDARWETVPYHSRPTQTLPPVFVQNASLEIAWTATVLEQRSISGTRVQPFLTEGLEGIDINTPADWHRAELMVTARQILPADKQALQQHIMAIEHGLIQ